MPRPPSSARACWAHFAVNCLRPAVGERFVAKARVLRAGRQQVFTHCELYAQHRGEDKLVATGETLLCVVAADTGA
jgi:acyl-coenzyme A thioesterase PaaI-like protein